MEVLIIEPGKTPHLADIKNDLKTLQEIVGGYIEVVYPFENSICLICNEEGKLIGLPLNRSLEDFDIIAGTFVIVGLGEDNFCSLTPDQVDKYRQKFEKPEIFLKMGRSIVSIPIKPGEEVHLPDLKHEPRKPTDRER